MRVAIIEDEDKPYYELKKNLEYFFIKEDIEVVITRYLRADSFLDNYRALYDIVFLDIEVPGEFDGLEAAKRLRQIDSVVLLIFVTKMARYVRMGYEVNALDYIIKPIIYNELEMKLKRAVIICRNNSNSKIFIPLANNGFYRIQSKELMYVEVIGHNLIYHITNNKITTRGTMAIVAKKLGSYGFLQCNQCYLVNMRHVNCVKGNMVQVGDTSLSISRSRRKTFLTEMVKWSEGIE